MSLLTEGLAEEWAKDLEANPDKQGKGSLNSEGKFCCLGRLCELLVVRGLVVAHRPLAWDGSPISTTRVAYRLTDQRPDEATDGTPNKYILDTIGMTRAEVDTFVDLNDSRDKTFPEIAAVVREMYVVDSEQKGGEDG